jgi:hypothetical protein
MAYGTIALDAISSSGNLSITGNVASSGNITATNIPVTGAMYPLMMGTAITTTTGTTVDYTSLPNWVKRITLSFAGVSTNSTSGLIVRLSTGSVFATTGYVAASDSMATTVAPNARTDAFPLGDVTITAAELFSGTYTFTNIGSNTWVGTLAGASTTLPSVFAGGGYVTLGGVLDGIRLTTIAGTATFDAGTVNILYE